MPLIKSASGVRGTLGGSPGDGLTPVDVVTITAAFGSWLLEANLGKTVVIGRDARPSGLMVSQLVSATLQGLGMDVIDVGLSTTPTVEMAVTHHRACGGIVITASHNPIAWNALKLLNHEGEFLTNTVASEVFRRADLAAYSFASVAQLGSYKKQSEAIAYHIDQILALPLVDVQAIRDRQFRIALDGVNSTGGIAIPKLLEALGVAHITPVHCEPNGCFPHNPEPLSEHLGDLIQVVSSGEHDLGLAVDPDVDRLVVIDEKGQPWGEDYTLVAAIDYVLSRHPGSTVANLSSSKAIEDITIKHGGEYVSSAVGEQHVVTKMKAVQAVIGGEGNGGVIYPALHYGRDALVGVALLLSHLARTGQTASAMRAGYTSYGMAKQKVILTPSTDVDALLQQVKHCYSDYPLNIEDGVKVSFKEGWVHLRKSNTEPLIRIYAEAATTEAAERLIEQVKSHLSL